jgi:hypothetical protein
VGAGAAGGPAVGAAESIARSPGSGDEVEVNISGGSLAGRHRAEGDLSCFVDESGWSVGLTQTRASG